MENCTSSKITVITKITTIIFRKTPITPATCPDFVMCRKIPNIYKGNTGIITAVITRSMISLKSSITAFKRPPSMTDIPSPSVNASISADITPITDGMSTVK